MADTVFNYRTLTAGINKMRTVKTPVLDKVFGRKKRQLSSMFKWDIKSNAERILKNIKVSAPAQVQDKTGRKTVTCEAPRYAPKRFIATGDLDAMRAYGSEAPELMKERVAEEQSDMKEDVDRTREFQAVEAIKGTVVDEEGNVIVSYNFSAEQMPVLAGIELWTDPASNPVKKIRGWKKWISHRVTVDKFIAFCGSGAMDALIDNPKALELLKYNAGKQIAEEGRIASLAAVDIEEYFGTYKNAAEDIIEMIPDDAFILIGLSAKAAAELFAPIADSKAAGGIGNGKPGQVFASKAWDEEDPDGKWIKAESRPLPVLFMPECVVYARVI
ncbi:MAG: major capsid protein [Deltaproteobacteria bacterium]|nr:major capsid protein [Deltaproteobacteria bacterium]